MTNPDLAAESWRPEALAALAQAVPFFARRILLCPAGRGELGHLLKRRQGVEVHGLETDPEKARIAAVLLDGVTECEPAGAFPGLPFDLCLFAAVPAEKDFEAVLPCLAPSGYAGIVAPSSDDEDRIAPAARAFSEFAARAGWPLYRKLPVDEDRVLLLLVRSDYNPLEHAHGFFHADRPESCYEVLELIPDAYLDTPQVAATVYSERELSLLAWLKRSPGMDRFEAFVKAQQLFYRLVACAPDYAQGYQVHAEFWRYLGDSDMAGRILRSFHRVHPRPEVEEQLAALPPVLRRPDAIAAPEHDPGFAPRVLFVTHPRYHYGLDVLYDGLCTVLGGGNVLEYPYKPSLHGELPEHMRHYPCSFDLPGEPAALERVLAELRDGAFDLVLWGDCEQGVPQAEARRIAEAASDTPVFIVDQLDEPLSVRERVRAYTGGLLEAGYFKREHLACADHGPNTFPLPFAYPDGRVAVAADTERDVPLFWAGHRLFGMRRLYLEHIERRFGLDLAGTFEQREYAARLGRARLALNLFGAGFDTVRYWEIPAHGSMLFSERLPILIPHEFTDGENAVFFRDTAELEERLEHYLARPEESAAVAARGRAHFLRYHTGSARARQLLGWVQAALDQ